MPLLLFGLPALLATHWAVLPFDVWMAVLYGGVISLALASVFWYRGVRILGATRTGIYLHFEPVFALGTEPYAGRLDGLQCDSDIRQVHAVRLENERHADRDIFNFGDVNHGAAEAALLHLDQTFALEDADGLAHGRLADAELLAKVFLLRQQITVYEPAAHDAFAKLGGNELSQARLAHLQHGVH